jgi:hypothetical protein
MPSLLLTAYTTTHKPLHTTHHINLLTTLAHHSAIHLLHAAT